jgi:hypothetical protein
MTTKGPKAGAISIRRLSLAPAPGIWLQIKTGLAIKSGQVCQSYEGSKADRTATMNDAVHISKKGLAFWLMLFRGQAFRIDTLRLGHLLHVEIGQPCLSSIARRRSSNVSHRRPAPT